MSSIENLLHKIDKKTEVIEEKINGINRRLDILNGKTEESVKRIDNIENWKENLKGKIAIITGIVSVFISLTIGILIKIFK